MIYTEVVCMMYVWRRIGDWAQRLGVKEGGMMKSLKGKGFKIFNFVFITLLLGGLACIVVLDASFIQLTFRALACVIFLVSILVGIAVLQQGKNYLANPSVMPRKKKERLLHGEQEMTSMGKPQSAGLMKKKKEDD